MAAIDPNVLIAAVVEGLPVEAQVAWVIKVAAAYVRMYRAERLPEEALEENLRTLLRVVALYKGDPKSDR
jgi:hypothetical protein